VRVTTLAPTGPGSFLEALNFKGPRIIVFEVGGVIDLGGHKVTIREPFLTIAGQTAPSPGITIIRNGLFVRAHDVVIRHLRVRPGEAGRAKKRGWDVDGITCGDGARDVIVDHCSVSWATDENLDIWGEPFRGATPAEWHANNVQRITYSHNIVAEGLHDSTNTKGPHSKGLLIGDNTTGILVLGNLFAGNVERNPEVKGGVRAAVVNNFISTCCATPARARGIATRSTAASSSKPAPAPAASSTARRKPAATPPPPRLAPHFIPPSGTCARWYGASETPGESLGHGAGGGEGGHGQGQGGFVAGVDA
jgi:pectate lyase